MGNSNLDYGAFQNNIDKLDMREKYRKEQHDGTRIIFQREISPVQMYQNVMDKTVFLYKNRVPEEGKRIITRLNGIKGKRIAGSVIQWTGVLLTALFVLFVFRYQSIDWNNHIKITFMLAMAAGILILLVLGGFIRISGRKLMADYLDVWNPLKAPVEINRLENGQLAIIKYKNRDKSCGAYPSALNPDDTIWKGTMLNCSMLPTYVEYMYIIDCVKSCSKTKSGILIESSGRTYGMRMARLYHSNSEPFRLSVFAESHISYRRDEIPAIFTDMDQLESSLMNYGYFEPGRNTFSPL